MLSEPGQQEKLIEASPVVAVDRVPPEALGEEEAHELVDAASRLPVPRLPGATLEVRLITKHREGFRLPGVVDPYEEGLGEARSLRVTVLALNVEGAELPPLDPTREGFKEVACLPHGISSLLA